MHSINNKNKLFDLLTQGATLLTPNNRLSAALLKDYFYHCNQKTLDKPSCMPYGTALINAYQQFQFQHIQCRQVRFGQIQ